MNQFYNTMTDAFEPDYDCGTGDISETLEFTLEGDGDIESIFADKLNDVIEYAESLGFKVRT